MKDLLWHHGGVAEQQFSLEALLIVARCRSRSCVEARLKFQHFGAVDADEGVIAFAALRTFGTANDDL